MIERFMSKPPQNSTGGTYVVSGEDSVRKLSDFPQSSVGAPIPCVLASEHYLVVAYACERHDPNWDGTYIRIASSSEDEIVCVVRFGRPIAHFFGPPNDEAFSGHPLSDRGLKPYGAYEVVSSSWIRALERMNSVHPNHSPEHFSVYKHFILTFHDTTFECVACDYSHEVQHGSLRDIVSGLCAAL